MLKTSNEDIVLDSISNKMSINIILDDKDIYDMLCDKNGNEKIDLVKRSIKIGMIALKNAVITIDTRYVEKELNRLIIVLDDNLKNSLGKEGMKGELERFFGKNGTLELNLREIFRNHEILINDILNENNINSPLSRIRKFIEDNSRSIDSSMYRLLDPGNRDSLTYRLKEDIIKKLEDNRRSDNLEIININQSLDNLKDTNLLEKETIKNDIQRFKDDVDSKFAEMKRSLHDEIDYVKNVAVNTNTEIAKIVVEKKIIDQTTLKGISFEEILYQFLATKALTKYGDTIDVANLSGGSISGDFIVNIKGSKDKIIIKAESTSKTNVQTSDTILKHLNITMKNRDAGYGIKVYENELPDSIGPILIGDNKIICSFLRGYSFEGYPLEVAYEILRSGILRKNLSINYNDVREHIDNIVRLMDSYQTIVGNLSKMENICANTKDHVESLRKNIFTELDIIMNKSNIEDKQNINSKVEVAAECEKIDKEYKEKDKEYKEKDKEYKEKDKEKKEKDKEKKEKDIDEKEPLSNKEAKKPKVKRKRVTNGEK